MIEHKAYECEFCGEEFDSTEYEMAIKHESQCSCNPKYMKCGSCKYSIKVTSYGVDYIKCDKLRFSYESCNDWRK
jgi:hypothetical protein